MSTFEDRKRVLEERIASASRELERLEENTKYDRIGQMLDGTIIKFKRRFSRGGRPYLYAAIKASGSWYTTGPSSPKEYAWEQFLPWILSGLEGEILICGSLITVEEWEVAVQAEAQMGSFGTPLS